jgi:hypothetical protein
MRELLSNLKSSGCGEIEHLSRGSPQAPGIKIPAIVRACQF